MPYGAFHNRKTQINHVLCTWQAVVDNMEEDSSSCYSYTVGSLPKLVALDNLAHTPTQRAAHTRQLQEYCQYGSCALQTFQHHKAVIHASSRSESIQSKTMHVYKLNRRPISIPIQSLQREADALLPIAHPHIADFSQFRTSYAHAQAIAEQHRNIIQQSVKLHSTESRIQCESQAHTQSNRRSSWQDEAGHEDRAEEEEYDADWVPPDDRSEHSSDASSTGSSLSSEHGSDASSTESSLSSHSLYDDQHWLTDEEDSDGSEDESQERNDTQSFEDMGQHELVHGHHFSTPKEGLTNRSCYPVFGLIGRGQAVMQNMDSEGEKCRNEHK